MKLHALCSWLAASVHRVCTQLSLLWSLLISLNLSRVCPSDRQYSYKPPCFLFTSSKYCRSLAALNIFVNNCVSLVPPFTGRAVNTALTSNCSHLFTSSSSTECTAHIHIHHERDLRQESMLSIDSKDMLRSDLVVMWCDVQVLLLIIFFPRLILKILIPYLWTIKININEIFTVMFLRDILQLIFHSPVFSRSCIVLLHDSFCYITME